MLLLTITLLLRQASDAQLSIITVNSEGTFERIYNLFSLRVRGKPIAKSTLLEF
jgi:hypothetical protein